MQALTTTWNSGFIIVSYCVSTVGAWTSLVLVDQAIYFRKQKRYKEFQLFIILGAFSLGYSGIWSMHYIGMQALQIEGVEFSFDVGVTLLSLFFGIVFPAIGYLLAASKAPPNNTALLRPRDVVPILIRGLSWQLLLGGLVTGLGVALMHYTGMFGMKMKAIVEFNAGIVVASLIVAVSVATVGLLLVFHLNNPFFRLLAAFIMAGAVCGMHYTGMAAAKYYPDPTYQSYWTFGGEIDGTDFVPVVITSLLISLIFVNTTYNNLQILAREADLSRAIFVRFRQQIVSTLRELTKSRQNLRKARVELSCMSYARPTFRSYFNEMIEFIDQKFLPGPSSNTLADTDYDHLLKLEEEQLPLFLGEISRNETSHKEREKLETESQVECSSLTKTPSSPTKKNLLDAESKTEYIEPLQLETSRMDISLLPKGEFTPTLEEVLSNAVCFELLRDHCIRIRAEEMLACLLDLRFYRTYISEESKKKDLPRLWAQRIFETYLQKGSANQINLSDRLVTAVESSLQNPSVHLFADVEMEVTSLCLDNVWKVFTQSPAYDVCRWVLIKCNEPMRGMTERSVLPKSQSIISVNENPLFRPEFA